MTIVSLSVRYKSATVEEFIEKHAADLSGHGIFVKTDRAFSLGTLLQLDVRIADKQTLIAGVGRVVWRRETAQGERPVGIGVQFLRIDKSSRAVVERLLAAKPNAGRRYESEAEGLTHLPDTPAPSAPEPATIARPTGPHVPAAARPKPGWHKTTLMGVGQGNSSAPPAPGTVLPRPVPPPRRPGSPSVIPPPPATLPSKLLADLDQEPEDLTLIGDVPEMPEERKTTLVGVGAASAIAPRLPPPVAPPPRPNALALTPFGPPVGLLRPAVAPPHAPLPQVVPPPVSTPPLATESAPLVHESDIEVAELLPPDTEDEPEEETRMQTMDELLGEVSAIPPPVATAPMLPFEPSPPAPMFPIDDDPMFPVESDPPPPPAIETAPLPAPAPPAPRIPLPLVLPPREQFVPPMPSSVAIAQGMVTLQTRTRPIGVTARAAAASPRDKAIAAAGAALLVVAVAAFVAARPWKAPEAGEPDAPKESAKETTSAAPLANKGWSTTPPTATAAPTVIAPPTATAVATAPVAAPAPPAPSPPPVAPPVAAPPSPPPSPPLPRAEAPVAAEPPPVVASPPPRPKVQSAAPPPATAPAAPSPVPASPPAAAAPAAVASAARPPPKPAASPSRPAKPSVDDGF
jgi:uncharacterized protein (TIGR02266 family)